MNIENLLKLPANTCAYEQFDPRTLEPVNPETYIRLQELGWKPEDFSGRAVLDIGCNSGLLTIHALRLGAKQVHACDVQPVFAQFVSRLRQERKLPITVSQIAFDKLKPTEHKTEIVLFMEVLHWAVSQGLELRDVIRRLAGLTTELLYIEFPWSVKEPSIQKQTKLTEDTYSADAVLDELTRYFANVHVVRFMHYFGFDSGSSRVLIEARGKRPEASLLAQLPRAYSLDVALSRGRNQSYLLNSPQGPLFSKLLPAESPLTKIPEALCIRMFDQLHSGKPTTIVLPQKVNGRYLLPADESQHWMVLPFMGLLPSAGKPKAFPIDFARLTDLFMRVRSDLRIVSEDLIETLREQGLIRDVKSLASSSATWVTDPGELASIKDGLVEALNILLNEDIERLDALCHGDLQTGNIVFDSSDLARVVDLDALTIGPIYSDGLLGLIWRGVDAEVLRDFCAKLEQEEQRAVTHYDVSYAIANGISWYGAVRQKPGPVTQDQINRLRNGLTAALQFQASLA
jgi:SAM-dependent methyltransferase